MKFIALIIGLLILIALPMELFSSQEKEIDDLEEEILSIHAENQELKQTLHMIQMRNEGIEYIDELTETELPWEKN